MTRKQGNWDVGADDPVRPRMDQAEQEKHTLGTQIADEINLSGINMIFIDQKPVARRLAWLLVLLAVFTTLIWTIVTRTTTFLSDPKAVNVDERYHMELDFPAVTICNMNLFRKSAGYLMERKILEDNEWSPFQKLPTNVLQLFLDYFPLSYTHQYGNKTLIHEIIREHEVLIGAVEGGLNIGMIYENLDMFYERSIIRCMYNSQTCTINNFTRVVTDGGVCLLFNGPNKTMPNTTKSGVHGGLHLELDAEQYDYLFFDPLLSTSAGFKVIVHDPDVSMLTTLDRGDFVSVGMATRISIQREQRSQLAGDPAHCNLDTEVVTCMLKCTARYVGTKCRCKGASYPGPWPICSIDKAMICMYIEEMDLLKETNYDEICKCSPKCKRNIFKTAVSQGKLAENMIARTAATKKIPAARMGALRLEDYITIYMTDHEWTNSLLDISNAYEAARNKLLSIGHLIKDSIAENVDQSEADCLMRAAESVAHSVINFSIWENSSYYLDLGPSENFMSRMAHDILRRRNEMVGFSAGFLLQLEQVDNSSVGVRLCNSTHGEYVMNATTEQLLDAKNIMQRITTSYTNLQTDIANNQDNIRLAPIEKQTAEMYFRQNFVALDIYYPELSTIKIIQQRADSWNSLICDMGGSLGLYIGASFLTIFEILDTCFWYFRAKSKTRKVVNLQKPSRT